MTDNIPFLTIPIDWRVPGAFIEIDHSHAVRGLPQMPHKMLILGQRLPNSVVGSGVLTRVTRKEDGINYFGRGSMLAQQIEAALTVNPYTECYALALQDDTTGPFATKIITVTGTPTETGTVFLYIGGRRITVGVIASQTPTEIATSIVNAVNADLDGAVTADNVAGVVTLTLRHRGSVGNNIDIRTNYYAGEQTPAGIGLAFSSGAVGTVNPDVTLLLPAMANLNSYTIITPWPDAANMAILETELADRWSGMSMRAGHVFVHASGLFSQLAAYGSTRNSAHSTIIGLGSSPTLPWVISAQFGAAVEFAGAVDPARPFRSLPLPSVLAPAENQRLTDTERNLLMRDGISTIIFDQSGAAMVEQVLTTYQQNSFGIEDVSLLKLNTKWTVDYMRYVFRFAVLRDFPRHKLAGDDVLPRIQPGQPIATPKLIRNTLIAAAQELERVGLLEDLEQFIKDLQVVRSTADVNRVNAILPPNVVNQFDVFAAAVQYIL